MTLLQRLKSILCLVIACFSPSMGNQAISLDEHVKKPSEADIKCLAANLFFEARGEGIRGMELVGQVVLNRMKKQNKSACAIILAPFQFSWFQKIGFVPHVPEYYRALAVSILTYGPREATENITHYHTTSVKPKWVEKMKVKIIHGNHIFYEEMK